MIGAIVGDIVGSRFEFDSFKSKKFEFFTDECDFTDDSIMSLAICKAFLEWKSQEYGDLQKKIIASMQKLAADYPNPYGGYGSGFRNWLFNNPAPYNSCGNGAGMRVSGCAYVAKNLEEAKQLSRIATEFTHNHPEGIKGAEATTVATFLALKGKSMEEIKAEMVKNYYPLDFTLDEIRPDYQFEATCQKTIPQALVAFFESNSFEDAIRNAISLGGDADTLGAITGAVAGAYYGVPEDIRAEALTYLDSALKKILLDFEYLFIESKKL